MNFIDGKSFGTITHLKEKRVINYDAMNGSAAIVAKEQFTKGVHEWNVQILTKNVNWIGVGVIDLKTPLKSLNKEKYYLCGSTLLSHNMSLNKTAEFTTGSIFKCRLDMDKGEL